MIAASRIIMIIQLLYIMKMYCDISLIERQQSYGTVIINNIITFFSRQDCRIPNK